MSSQYSSYRRSAISLWGIIFRLEGNVLFAVLPFCIINGLLLALVGYCREKYKFEFSPSGHGLLTLLISFLVISKVTLSYDRYKAVRQYASQAAIALREFIQLVMMVSNKPISNDDQERELRHWRLECVSKVTEILDATVCVVKNRLLAKHFSFNKSPPITTDQKVKPKGFGGITIDDVETLVSDPLTLVQSLRLHVYCTPGLDLELLERMHLVNRLQEYTMCYTHLLNLASTPLPFPLVQMGRAFLLIWTFSMPLVLLDGPFSSMWAAQAFLFFLTYGFIGLELVSMKLSDPFGNGRDDVQLSGIRDAALLGIENDLKEMTTMQATISERRLRFSQQKANNKQQYPQPIWVDQEASTKNFQVGHHSDVVYHAMGGGDVHH